VQGHLIKSVINIVIVQHYKSKLTDERLEHKFKNAPNGRATGRFIQYANHREARKQGQ
jgi:hypothetical protein